MSRPTGKLNWLNVAGTVLATALVACPTALIAIGARTTQMDQTKADVAELKSNAHVDHDAIVRTDENVKIIIKKLDGLDLRSADLRSADLRSASPRATK